jgi:hypothetical protein
MALYVYARIRSSPHSTSAFSVPGTTFLQKSFRVAGGVHSSRIRTQNVLAMSSAEYRAKGVFVERETEVAQITETETEAEIQTQSQTHTDTE